MDHKKPYNLILIVRFFGGKTKNVLDELTNAVEIVTHHELGNTARIHWNFPCLPLLEEQSIPAKTLLGRISERAGFDNDILIPMGFTGSFHGLLTEDELQKEIGWGLTNEWGTGFLDQFKFTPQLCMPSQMDFLRTSSRIIYNESPFIWIIPPETHTADQRFSVQIEQLEVFDHGNLYRIPFLNLPCSRTILNKILKKAFRKQISPIVLLADFSTGCTAADIHDFLNVIGKLSEKYAIVFSHLSNWLLPGMKNTAAHEETHLPPADRIPGSDLPFISLPHDPADRIQRIEGIRLRYQLYNGIQPDERNSVIRNMLYNFSLMKRAGIEHARHIIHEQTPVQRRLIADMPGTVVLKEKNFEALFSGGRFINIIAGSRPVLAGIPAATFVETADIVYHFESESVFSFENRGHRGLRETVLLDLPISVRPGRIITDYLFFEEFPCLILSLDITYPVFPEEITLTGYAPMELNIFRIKHGETFTFRGKYPDGNHYTIAAAAEEADYEFPGSFFSIEYNGNAFALLYPPIRERNIEILPVRMKADRKGFILSVNPGGNYRPASSTLLDGYSEHFTFIIAAGEKGQTEDIGIPDTVLHHLQGQWLKKTRSLDTAG